MTCRRKGIHVRTLYGQVKTKAMIKYLKIKELREKLDPGKDI
ncbi:hypothetical protein OAZ88_00885 [bacterium]|nr:hypothetical protein [bacterium]